MQMQSWSINIRQIRDLIGLKLLISLCPKSWPVMVVGHVTLFDASFWLGVLGWGRWGNNQDWSIDTRNFHLSHDIQAYFIADRRHCSDEPTIGTWESKENAQSQGNDILFLMNFLSTSKHRLLNLAKSGSSLNHGLPTRPLIAAAAAVANSMQT